MMMKLKLMIMKTTPRRAKQAACGDKEGTQGRPGQRGSQPLSEPRVCPSPCTPAHAYQYFGGGAQRLLVLGHDADVEDGREDEDEAGSRGGTWSRQGQSGQGPPTLQLSPASPTARTGPVHPHPLLVPPSPGKAFQEAGDTVCWHCPHTPPAARAWHGAERGAGGARLGGSGQTRRARAGAGSGLWEPACQARLGWGIHGTTCSWHGEREGETKALRGQPKPSTRQDRDMTKQGQEQGPATHQSSRRCREWRGQR